MPTYTYICNDCSCKFELFFYIKDYQPKPKCIKCLGKHTERSYTDDLSGLSASVKKSDNELKTIGDLANRNRDKLSEDHKQELYNKHNAYKDKESKQELPTGMKRLQKQPKIQWYDK